MPHEYIHGKWYRDRNIDANLAGIDLLLKFASSRSRLCEDGRAITI